MPQQNPKVKHINISTTKIYESLQLSGINQALQTYTASWPFRSDVATTVSQTYQNEQAKHYEFS